jgi:hypothetical protein
MKKPRVRKICYKCGATMSSTKKIFFCKQCHAAYISRQDALVFTYRALLVITILLVLLFVVMLTLCK